MNINDLWLCEHDTLTSFLNNMRQGYKPVNINSLQLAPVIDGRRAVISISGMLMKSRQPWMWGVTSYQEIIEAVQAVEDMPGIDEIVLDFSSGGGGVLGLAEAAEAISNCKKKTTAYASFCCSAAYWLASQCDSIVTEENAIVGSIGVMRAVADYTKMYDDWGIKIELFRSGELKGDGVPGTSLSDGQRASIQREIDGLAANFRATVMTGRNLTEVQMEAITTGEAWCAKDALALGLIDSINNSFLNSSLQSANSQKGTKMEKEKELAKAEELKNAEAKGNEDGYKAAMTDLTQMLAAFPNDQAFAVKQFQARVSLLEAKAAYADVLADENKKLKEQAEAAKQEQQDLANFEGEEEPVANGKPGNNSTKIDFAVKLTEYMEANKCDKVTAIKACRKDYQDAYNAYCKRPQKGGN